MILKAKFIFSRTSLRPSGSSYQVNDKQIVFSKIQRKMNESNTTFDASYRQRSTNLLPVEANITSGLLVYIPMRTSHQSNSVSVRR